MQFGQLASESSQLSRTKEVNQLFTPVEAASQIPSNAWPLGWKSFSVVMVGYTTRWTVKSTSWCVRVSCLNNHQSGIGNQSLASIKVSLNQGIPAQDKATYTPHGDRTELVKRYIKYTIPCRTAKSEGQSSPYPGLYGCHTVNCQSRVINEMNGQVHLRQSGIITQMNSQV